MKRYKGHRVECGCDRDWSLVYKLNNYEIGFPRKGKYSKICKKCKEYPWYYKTPEAFKKVSK